MAKPTIELTDSIKMEACYAATLKYIDERIDLLRSKNDSSMDMGKTEWIRGGIKELKILRAELDPKVILTEQPNSNGEPL